MYKIKINNQIIALEKDYEEALFIKDWHVSNGKKNIKIEREVKQVK